MATAVEQSCEQTKLEYHRCLSSSGRSPSKCGLLEAQLRGCAKSLDKSFCIDEGTQLMNCVRKGRSSNSCASEFVKMRECNRPRGPEIVVEDGQYVVAEAARGSYQLTAGNSSSSLAICSTSPPPSPCSTSELREMLEKRKEALNR
eukprot:GHVS01097753.1.p2 GENE.GHVS01097753.1~~GHVS01097753.1.p2  ORF type:complete len:146 (-),score=40.65 GHVS01097753.1:145-582(-)